jgi:excisionase family DNA binding protein
MRCGAVRRAGIPAGVLDFHDDQQRPAAIIDFQQVDATTPAGSDRHGRLRPGVALSHTVGVLGGDPPAERLADAQRIRLKAPSPYVLDHAATCLGRPAACWMSGPLWNAKRKVAARKPKPEGRTMATRPTAAAGQASGSAERYLRGAEVAELLQVSAKTVARWAKDGKLPFARTLGGHRRYPESSIRSLVSQLTTTVLPPPP